MTQSLPNKCCSIQENFRSFLCESSMKKVDLCRTRKRTGNLFQCNLLTSIHPQFRSMTTARTKNIEYESQLPADKTSPDNQSMPFIEARSAPPTSICTLAAIGCKIPTTCAFPSNTNEIK